MANVVETDFQVKWLWDDPLKNEEWFDTNRGPVLLAEEILLYVKKYGLLFVENYDKGTLRGASYSMTPDPKGAWTFDEKKRKSSLKIGKDEDGSFLLVPDNSLVYIRLQQKLRIPFYIIGRYNLKIRYIYQGLLLGTGPQVDPGYEGRFYVPLHNLTNNDVKIYLDKTFVAIDFIRTSNLHIINSDTINKEQFYKENLNIPAYPQYKIDRDQLEDYLEGNTPASSLGRLVEDLKSAKATFESFLQKVKFDIIGGAAVILAVFAIMTGAYFHLENKFRSTYEDNKYLLANSIRIDKLEQAIHENHDQQEQTNKNMVDRHHFLKQIDQVQRKIYKLEERIAEIKATVGIKQQKVSNFKKSQK